jgi:hypothetical protein
MLRARSDKMTIQSRHDPFKPVLASANISHHISASPKLLVATTSN